VKNFLVFIIVTAIFVVVPLANASESSSTNFLLQDEALMTDGGYSSSSSFQYNSLDGQTSAGEGTGTNFINRSGVLYYPQATSPVLIATAGDAQVVLTWTSSVGTLANITDYQVGFSTSSSGPFTYTAVSDVLTYTKTGLTNSTAYYFKIQAYAGTQFLAESAVGSSTPTGEEEEGGGGGGGGGGGAITTGRASVTFSGRAYPMSYVTVLKDGQETITTIAGPDAIFEVTLSGLSSGDFNFSLYGTDDAGRRSSLFTFPVYVTANTSTTVSGIFISPTLAVDKETVAQGDNLAIFGQTSPDSNVTIAVNSENSIFAQVSSDNDGVYLYNFDTSVLELGQHFTKSKSAVASTISSYSRSVGFVVGDISIPIDGVETGVCGGIADLNCDGRVNLIDFSIEAYWYLRLSPPAQVDLNGDGGVDLVDFSIMAYYWTG